MATRTIETTRFGTVEAPEERIFAFPEGIPGFDQVREFVLIDHPGSPAFRWLQSTTLPGLAFVVTNPLLFKPDYAIQVHAEDLSTLGVDDVASAEVFVILVVPKDHPEQMTANLQGPVILNPARRVGKQLVLAGNQYPIKYPVFAEARQASTSSGKSLTGSG